MTEEYPIEKLKNFWNKYADEYERLSKGFNLVLYKLLLPFVHLSSASCIIEAGCGTGYCLHELCCQVPSTCRVLANDISEEMVKKAQSKGLNAEIILADNEQLPYEDSLADAYIAHLSLHLVRNPTVMLAEALRVLKLSGVAVLSVWGKQEYNNMIMIILRACDKTGLKSQLSRSFDLSDKETINGMMAEAGFRNVRSFYTAVGVEVESGAELYEKIKDSPGIGEFKDENIEKYEELGRNIVEEVDSVLNNGWIITLDVLIVVGNKN